MSHSNTTLKDARLDHSIIYNIVESRSRVLDLGCGDGELMALLARGKSVKTQGIEISEEAVYKCVEKGVSVFHGDIDTGLIEYPDKSFDYVILNQSMQQVKNVRVVIGEALRIGEKVIIGFPNFAYFPGRTRLFFRGKSPVTISLPYRWYDTPNLHFLTISDFIQFCVEKRIKVLKAHYYTARKVVKIWPNMRAANAIFLIASNSRK